MGQALAYSGDTPTWFIVAIVWFVVVFAIVVFVQRQATTSAMKTLEGVPDGKDLPAKYTPLGRRIRMAGGLLGISIIGIAALMVWTPGQ